MIESCYYKDNSEVNLNFDTCDHCIPTWGCWQFLLLFLSVLALPVSELASQLQNSVSHHVPFHSHSFADQSERTITGLCALDEITIFSKILFFTLDIFLKNCIQLKLFTETNNE